MERSTKIIAVAGKGGVGKTSISAAFIRLLTEAFPDQRIRRRIHCRGGVVEDQHLRFL